MCIRDRGKRAAQNLTSSWGQEAEGCGAELVSVDSVAEGIELILSGRADCMLNAETAFYDYMNKHPDAPVKIVAATDTTTSSQIPVPKGNERLVEAINEMCIRDRAGRDAGIPPRRRCSAPGPLPENSAERAVPRSPPPFDSSIAENSIRFNYGNK